MWQGHKIAPKWLQSHRDIVSLHADFLQFLSFVVKLGNCAASHFLCSNQNPEAYPIIVVVLPLFPLSPPINIQQPQPTKMALKYLICMNRQGKVRLAKYYVDLSVGYELLG